MGNLEAHLTQLPEIADLSGLGLSRASLAARAFSIGGSDANIIASGDADRIYRLWQEKTDRVQAEDLSRVLAVQMGNWTEPFNAAWYQQETGDFVSSRDTSLTCPVNPWRTATLDGYCSVDGKPAVWEAKHSNAFKPKDELVATYTPQLMHNMAVTGLDAAVLSVFRGNMEWFCQVVRFDEVYGAELFEIEEAFFNAILNDEPPVDLPQPMKPIEPGEMRVVEMTGNNEWASSAADYLENEAPKKKFDAAAKGLKGLVEADVKQASGHGIMIKRDTRGALRISKEK